MLDFLCPGRHKVQGRKPKFRGTVDRSCRESLCGRAPVPVTPEPFQRPERRRDSGVDGRGKPASGKAGRPTAIQEDVAWRQGNWEYLGHEIEPRLQPGLHFEYRGAPGRRAAEVGIRGSSRLAHGAELKYAESGKGADDVSKQ